MTILNNIGKVKGLVLLIIIIGLLLYIFKALPAPQNIKTERIILESQNAKEAIEEALNQYESNNKLPGFLTNLDDLENDFSSSEKNMWNLVTLGIIQMQQFNFRKAIDSFREAREIEPNAAEPYIGLGKAYYSLVAFTSMWGIDSSKAEAILSCAKNMLSHAKRLRPIIKTTPDGLRGGLFNEDEPDNTLNKVELSLQQFREDSNLNKPIEKDLAETNIRHPIQIPPIVEEFLVKYDRETTPHPSEDRLKELEGYVANSNRTLWNLVNTGDFAAQMFKFRKAVNYYLEASQTDPSAAEPYIGLGKIYYTLALSVVLNKEKDEDKIKQLLTLAKETLEYSKQLRLTIKIDTDGSKVTLFNIDEPMTTISKIENLMSSYSNYEK